jgi:hypothetical protein
MNTLSSGGNPAMQKTVVLSLTAALLLAAGCQVDVTQLKCSNSTECPTGYHCDMGTATTAGTFKCANGAAQQKTLAANATKFLLEQKSRADGTTRTTITADVGAVTSTPDFVGVRVIASQNGTDLASSQVLADGSVLQFQLPQAVLQVDLRIEDDSGHSVAVTGYREHIELNFLGKGIAGNTNAMAAYDAVSDSNSLYPPQTWISTGGPSGTALAEVAATYTALPDGGISPLASYQAMQQLDGVISSTAFPPQPDRDGGTVIGWEQISSVSTTTTTALIPPARVGAAMAMNGGEMMMYGGAAPDVDGGVVDPAGTWYTFNPNNGTGWTAFQQPPAGSNNPYPSTLFGSSGVSAPSARANAAMGNGGSQYCTPSPCGPSTSHRLIVAGGTTAAGALTDHIYAYGDKVFIGGGSTTTYTGWWDVTVEFGNGPTNKLPTPNAGMAYAPMFNIQMPVNGNSSQQHAGAVLVGGVNVPPGVGATNWDSIGCLIAVGLPFSSTAGAAGTVVPCTTPEFATAAGALGFRSGVALVASDLGDSSVYLFGGNRSGATTPSSNGFKNDVWQGTIKVVCNPGGSTTLPCPTGTTAQTSVTWAQVTVAASPLPSPRANAGLAFADPRRLTVYGGTDASGNTLRDVWELDLAVAPATPQWRQIVLDPSPALAPAARSKFSFLGNFSYASYYTGVLVSGLVGTSPSMEVWALSKQAPSRLIVKAPVNLPRLDLATNLRLSVLAFGPIWAPLYVWDGSSWRFVARANEILAAALPSATGFIQPDSNVYFMFMPALRSNPGFTNTFATATLDSFQAFVDFN